MNNDKIIQVFAKRYNANIKTINHQYDRSTFHISSRSYDYYDDSKTVVSIEMPFGGFRNLVDSDNLAEEDYQEQRRERQLRAMYPAVNDAYEKYQMLLALCK
jgi:hypothetical protein